MISVARKIAFETLRRVEAEGAYATDVLHAELGESISAADAALATELTLGVLRWRGLLDFLLERLVRKPVAKLDLPVALTLRIGLYQLRFLQRIPARAAVNESVEMVKAARKTSAATLVNAVLRRAAGEAATPAETFLSADLSMAERLSILHSHPRWIVGRWLARFGEDRTVALLETNNRAPRLSVTVHDDSQRDAIAEEFQREGLRVEHGSLLKSALAVKGGSVARTTAFREGRISIQDEASQAVPLLLDVRAGDRVLDLCAAPGGKTAMLARAAGAAGRVIAADLYGHRLSAMHAQCARLGLTNVQLMQVDATKPLALSETFQRVLVDAPCSGTGTLARHPEIKWRLKAEQIAEFHELQLQILRNAMAALAPGGKLVYSTCSLETEENELVVDVALAMDKSARRLPAAEIAAALQPHLAAGVSATSLLGESADGGAQFRTFPPETHSDGFFAAVIEKA